MIKTAGLWALDLRDVAKGLIVAIFAAIIPVITESLQQKEFVFDLTAIWHTAAAAGVAYLAHRFITPAQKITPAE